jgi:hypothetical protein
VKTPTSTTCKADEAEARRRAKLIGLAFMAASAVTTLLVLTGLWWIVRRLL